MKTLIIEDEKQAVIALKEEIRLNCPDIEVCGTAASVDEAFELVNKEKPGLIFLDIQLKSGNGFDLLSRIDTSSIKVIFTTAYSEYALKAIKFSALDYLLKPIDGEELVRAVEKAKKISLEETQLQLRSFIQNQNLNPLSKKIALHTSKGIYLYELERIIRLQSEGNYTNIYLKDGKKVTVAKTLREFEELLDTSGFCRIHHSHIINLNHLESYINKDGGYVIMGNNATLPVSKRKKGDLLSLLGNINS